MRRAVYFCSFQNQATKIVSTIKLKSNIVVLGIGCGAVDSLVASDYRGPGFQSSHKQLLLSNYLLLTVCRKDGNKEKEAGNYPFFKKGCAWDSNLELQDCTVRPLSVLSTFRLLPVLYRCSPGLELRLS